MGILSQHVGVFSMQNMLALLQNGAVHRQLREQKPLETVVERTAENNPLENYFSLIAIHGYKPRMMELQARARSDPPWSPPHSAPMETPLPPASL